MSSTETEAPLPLPIEIIFSCAICQATILEIYKPGDIDSGLRENNSEDDRPATKLWLTECGHLTCGKHLPDGGAPFHRADDVPRAPCPICSSEKNDVKEKALHGIRGCADGSFDTGIPKSWFDSPPIKLDGQGKGMDALRFHYLSLIRFGTSMLAKYRISQASVAEHRKNATDARDTQIKLNDEISRLRSRIEKLQNCEKELQSWREREPKIKYYLGAFQEITKENQKLKEQLAALGYAVPNKRYSYEAEFPQSNDQHPGTARGTQAGTAYPDEEQQNDYAHAKSAVMSQQRDRQDTSSSRTLSGPPPLSAPQARSGPLQNLHTHEAIRKDTLPPSKRKRDDGNLRLEHNMIEDLRDDGRNSRDLMPPPPLPTGMQYVPLAQAGGMSDSESPRQKRMRLGERLLDADSAVLEDGFWQPLDRIMAREARQTNGEPSRTSRAFVKRQSGNNNSLPTNQPNGLYYQESPSRGQFNRVPWEDIRRQTSYSTSQNESARDHQIAPDFGPYEADLYDVSPTLRRPLDHIDSNTINGDARHSQHIGRTRRFSPSKHVYPQLPHTPSPQKGNLRALSRREPVTSPFFTRQGAIPYSGSSRLTLNPDPILSRNGQIASSPYKMPAQRPPSTERRALNRLSFVSQPEISAGGLSPRKLLIPYTTQPSYNQVVMSSHATSRDTQGLFKRPDTINHTGSSYQRPHVLDRKSPVKQPRTLRDIPVLAPSTPSVASSLYPSQRNLHLEFNPSSSRLSRRQAGGSIGRSGASRPSLEGTRNNRDLHLGDFLDMRQEGYENSSASGRVGSRRIVRR